MEYPTFYAVAKLGGAPLALTLNGLADKNKAESHLKMLGYTDFEFVDSRDAAEKKAETVTADVTETAPASVADVLKPGA